MKATKKCFVVILLLAISSVIVLTDWSCKSNHQESNSNLKDSSLSIKSLTGTLIITPVLEKTDSVSDYWVYIDKTIVETRTPTYEDPNPLNPIEVLLVPGDYNVEVALPSNRYSAYFPFSWRSENVIVRAGETTSINLSVDIDYSYSINMGAFYPLSGEWEEWYANILNRANETHNNWYRTNPVARALNDVSISLSVSPPITNKVFINLPEEYGGGHQFDAKQIRMIVEWLGHEIWDWFPSYHPDNMPDNVRTALSNLEPIITQDKNAFNRIAEQLEQVKE